MLALLAPHAAPHLARYPARYPAQYPDSHPARHLRRPRRRAGRPALVAVLVVALSMVALSVTGGVAQGQPSSDQMAQAQALFDEGIRLFNVGRFEDACPKFEASLALVAGVGTRGKLAECYEKVGKTASAWRLYREVERLAQRSDDTLRKQVASERARSLEPRLARLTIRPGPSVTLPGFQVRSNGQLVEPRIFDSEKIVDPGTYVIVASAPEHAQWSSTTHVAEGKRAVVEVRALQLGDDPGTEGTPSSRPSDMRITAYSLMGVGLVSTIGGGTYFGVKASNRWDKAFDNDHCDRVTLECDADGLILADAAKRNANFANISVGLGVAAVTAGAVLWWLSRTPPDDQNPQTVNVSPSLLPRGMGLVLSRQF
jgi:hypothetical protein